MKILKVSAKNFSEIIKETIKIIKSGGVVVCPTDTIYGILCDATNKKAVNRLFKIKKRLKAKPVPIFVKDLQMARKLARISENQKEFLKKVWPGKVTVVLKRRKIKLYGVDKETIGLRMPKYNLILRLIEILNYPLTGTSANISGERATTKIKEVIRQFESGEEHLDLIIDAGNLKKSKPSKVVDLTGITPKILRK